MELGFRSAISAKPRLAITRFSWFNSLLALNSFQTTLPMITNPPTSGQELMVPCDGRVSTFVLAYSRLIYIYVNNLLIVVLLSFFSSLTRSSVIQDSQEAVLRLRDTVLQALCIQFQFTLAVL